MTKIYWAIFLLFVSVAAIAQSGIVSVGGQVTFPTGLGNINQILGPTDEPLQIATQNSQNLYLLPDTDGDVGFPAGSVNFPSICPEVNPFGICLYWTGASEKLLAWRDCTGGSCPTTGNQVSAGLDDQGVRIVSGSGGTGGGAIRFIHNSLTTGTFTDGGIMTSSGGTGTLSLCAGSDCDGSVANPHTGNLNLASLHSFGTVTFNDGTTVGSSGFSYGTGYAGTEWITQPIGTATGNTLSGTANQMTLWGVVLPFPITTSNVSWNITTADNSAHTYDLCLYNSSGTLQTHIGPTAGTTFANSATGHNGSWTSSVLLQPGIYYEGLTSSCTSACATLGGTNANGVTFLTNSTVSVTSGGTCPGSITPPSSVYVFNASIPALIVR